MRFAPSVRAPALALVVHVACAGGALLAPSSLRAQSPVDEAVLPEVDISDSPVFDALMPSYEGGQVARGGRLGLLGNVDFMDAPFSQTSYTADLIEDRQAARLSDLLESDSSVRRGAARANFQEYFSIRGFMYGSQDVALNGLYGLTPYMRAPLEMAERIEVLKGPAAALTGMSLYGSAGGTINLVPKRAGAEPLARLSAGYQSDSQASVHADLGSRFGDGNAFGARLNAAYRDGATTIDRHEQEDGLVTLGLDYQGERFRASVDLLREDQEIDNFVRQFALDPSVSKIPAPPATGLNYPGFGHLTAEDSMATGRVEYDLGDNLTVHGAAGRRNHRTDVTGSVMLILLPGGVYAAPPGWQILEIHTTNYEAGVTGRFDTGVVRHSVSALASRLEDRQDTFFASPIGAVRFESLYDPFPQPLPDTTGITPDVGNYQDTRLTSYALADSLSMLDGKVQVTLGIRHQAVEAQAYDIFTHLPAGATYSDSAVTPIAALVVRPSHQLALYANYSEDLAKGPSATPPAVAVATMLPPIRTKQAEIGTKADWGKVSSTLSVFQIERPSAVVDGGVLSQNGEQRNRGIEVNAFGEPVRDVRALGGVTLMRGELTRTPGGLHDGNDAIAVPRIQASLTVDWANVAARGFGLNARVVYTGSQYADQANRVELPDWTRVDAGARYVRTMSGYPLALRLNVENLFDKSYWASSNAFSNNDAGGGYLYLSTGRAFMLSVTVDFSGKRSP